MNPKTGAFLIGLGVFFLLLLNVRWGEISALVRAYAVLGMGLVCVAAFFTSRRSTNMATEAGAEVTYQVASAIGAAIILGTVFGSLGGFPFWGLMDEEDRGKYAERDFELEAQVLIENAASLAIDVDTLDLRILGWGNAELAVNGSVKVFADSNEQAEERLNQTKVSISRATETGKPAFRIEVSTPEARSIFGRRGYRLSLTIHVPFETSMDLDCESVNGRYEVRDLRLGRSQIKTVNGDIELSGVEGNLLSASTTNGRINGTLAFGSANLSTLNGQVELNIGKSTGAYRLKSTNGNVVVMLPAGDDIGYSLKASTLNGAVQFEPVGLVYSVDRRNRKEAQTTGYASKLVKIAIEAATLNGEVRAELQSS